MPALKLTLCLGWPQTLILLISISQVAGVPGMSLCAHPPSLSFCSTLCWEIFPT
jgi:hypothetical protein